MQASFLRISRKIGIRGLVRSSLETYNGIQIYQPMFSNMMNTMMGSRTSVEPVLFEYVDFKKNALRVASYQTLNPTTG